MEIRLLHSSFSSEVIVLAVDGLMQGGQLFEGNPHRQGLAGVYCQALRYCLINEIWGVEAPPSQVLQDVVEHLVTETPHQVLDAIRSLPAEEFGEAYRIYRFKARELGVDIKQLANALAKAPQLARNLREKP